MRYWEIFTEAAKEDLDLLSEITNVVMDYIPAKFPEDYIIKVPKGRIADSPKVKAMYSSYEEKHHDAIKYLSQHVEFILNNERRLEGSTTAGAHQKVHEGSVIYVILPVIFGNADEKTKADLMSFNDPSKPLQSVESTLVHEMRHAIQSINFPKFFNRTEVGDYRSDPVEIDAAWIHHLKDRPVANYENADKFVNDVIVAFTKYKRLTAKQVRHYRRKTYRYYYDTIRKADIKQKPLQQRKQDMISNIIGDFREELIDATHDKRLSDWRNFGHPESGFFLFEPKMFIGSVNKLLTQPELDLGEVNTSYLYGFLALVHEIYPFDVEKLKKYILKTQGVTPETASSIVSEKGFGKWDKEFIVGKIKHVFG